MNEIWDKVYSDDESFFGENASHFAEMSYSDFKKQGVKKLLELGCGQGRDTIFFASNDLDVHALDSSIIAVENLHKKLREKNISIDLKHFDARQGIPFSNNFFDAIYAHMFFNMCFTDEELKFLFIESNRVLKNDGMLYFSVRSDKDAQYNTGKKIDTNIYEINGFQIRFFTKRQIQSFLENYFEIKNIEESYEEPVNLYFVFCRKK
ncbi:MAG TPA: class I SAM-dependent methyltransferase [Nitrososphaeraceae archaeon]